MGAHQVKPDVTTRTLPKCVISLACVLAIALLAACATPSAQPPGEAAGAAAATSSDLPGDISPSVTVEDPAADERGVADRLDQLVPSLLEEHNVPGAAVSLVLDGKVAWSAGYGLADRALGVPVTADTVFQVASVSKAVTAWGVMRLVERGLLNLDAPVERYLTRWHLPASDYDASGVTIRRLLSHTAGLSVGGFPGYPPDQTLPSLEESLSGNNRGAGVVRIAMEPGAQWSYSGGGYILLQLIVEEVTGETFSRYMQREVLEPLGMTHSSFEWRADLRPATAIAYSSAGSPLPNYLFTEQAAAGLYTTAPDLALLVAAAMPGTGGEPAGRGVLSPDTLTLMLTPAVQLSDQGEAWGLGYILLALTDGSVRIGHGGSNAGWQAFSAAVPDWGEGLVVLTNSENGTSVIEDVLSAVVDQLGHGTP
ncbi:MAG: beta-lactamase family protein [Chloroflexi bacterium]|nr:beta-lactamase family protein [Chloroflexota bacterium]